MHFAFRRPPSWIKPCSLNLLFIIVADKVDLLVMCGHACVGITRVFGVFDHQAFVLGQLEAPDAPQQLSAAEETTFMSVHTLK